MLISGETHSGTVTGSRAEIALRMWLSDEGVSWDDVEVVDTAALDLVAALTGGLVDAVIWTEPIPAQALAACGEEECRYVGEVRRGHWPDAEPLEHSVQAVYAVLRLDLLACEPRRE